eukprot:scaffold89038_cov51-Cyclotella_meneghiniana.AAC.4
MDQSREDPHSVGLESLSLLGGQTIWAFQMHHTITIGPLPMGDLQQAEDKAVAPMSSMFAQTPTLDVGKSCIIEQLGNATLQEITETKGINRFC